MWIMCVMWMMRLVRLMWSMRMVPRTSGGLPGYRWLDHRGHPRGRRRGCCSPKLRRGHLAYGSNLAKQRFVSLRPGAAQAWCVHGVQRARADGFIDTRRIAFHRGSHHHNWAGRVAHDQAR